MAPPQHGNKNPMFDQTPTSWSAFRQRVLAITVGLIGLLIIGLVIYGPWFRIQTVTIKGTHDLNPASVKKVTETYLQGTHWGIIPNANLWLLPRRQLATYLEEKIRQRLSIEQVVITKHFRHGVEVTITERTPVATWSTTTAKGIIDRNGVIITLTDQSQTMPLLVDQGDKPFTIGQTVLTGPVVSSVQQLHQAFQTAQLPVDRFIIPVPTCPTVIVEPTNANTAPTSNTNSDEVNTNSDLTNSMDTNTSEIVPGPQVERTNCNLADLAKNSQEIHAQLKNGPLVMFDRHENLTTAVNTVKRLITDKNNAGAVYIDVRFQERVYIK